MRAQPEPERLQKVLARLGLGSRRQVETWIEAGRLSLNGRIAKLGDRVGPGDQLRLDGRAVRLEAARLPKGGRPCFCATVPRARSWWGARRPTRA